MKVKELFENVVNVNFAQARAKRDAEATKHKKQQEVEQRYGELEQEDERETLTVHELAEFEEYAHTAKKKGRIPGFETMDDAVCYLLSDMELPSHITRSKAINWFSKLSEEEREKARMIAHHTDRMIQIYEILKTKLHGLQDTWNKRFNGKIPQGWDATDGAAWLDSEYTYDIQALKNLKQAVTILGQ
jgi:hypothetical protein